MFVETCEYVKCIKGTLLYQTPFGKLAKKLGLCLGKAELAAQTVSRSTHGTQCTGLNGNREASGRGVDERVKIRALARATTLRGVIMGKR